MTSKCGSTQTSCHDRQVPLKASFKLQLKCHHWYVKNCLKREKKFAGMFTLKGIAWIFKRFLPSFVKFVAVFYNDDQSYNSNQCNQQNMYTTRVWTDHVGVVECP